MTPKISERPLPTRNSSAPYEMPLKAWVSQNCVFIPSPTPLNRESPTSYLTTASAGRHRRFGLALVAAPCALLRCRFFRRNDRQQEIGLPPAAEVQAGDAAEDVLGTIARIVVQERPATRELVLEVRQLAAARPGIDIILAAHG